LKTCSDELKTFLASTDAKDLKIADLYTFTLVNGTVLRYTSAVKDIVHDGNTYLCKNSGLTRGDITDQDGLSINTLEVDFAPADTDYIGNMTMVEAFENGICDKAAFRLDWLFYTDEWFTTPLVLEKKFVGNVYIADDGIGRNTVKLEIKQNEEFGNKFPSDAYQAQCPYVLYGYGCGVTKSNFTFASTVLINSTNKIIYCGLMQSDGYFQNGVIEFTSGNNLGIKRSIKSYTSGILTLNLPLPYVPSSGDTFTASCGCDKTMSTCKNKFNNLSNFGGTPYIPNPDSTLG
jgi:uncharacterized phage protein (TIGR02218 family)